MSDELKTRSRLPSPPEHHSRPVDLRARWRVSAAGSGRADRTVCAAFADPGWPVVTTGSAWGEAHCMTTRIDAEVLIPGRGQPIANGSVVFDDGAIRFAGPTADAPVTDGGEV